MFIPSTAMPPTDPTPRLHFKVMWRWWQGWSGCPWGCSSDTCWQCTP